MSMGIDRARYDALVQLVAECVQQGQVPKPAWLDEIESIRLICPEWSVVPASLLIATPTSLPSMLFDVLPPAPPSSSPPRAAIPDRAVDRWPVTVDENMNRIVDEVLQAWAKRYCVFQSGGRLFEVQTGKGPELKFIECEANTPRMASVSTIRARALADRECKFAQEKFGKEGPSMSPCLPPDWLGGAIVSRPEFENIPIITALAQAPTLRRDGEIIWERGYDTSTGIYLASDLRINVPERPTREDASAAKSQLLDLVCDFDFVNAGGSSVWLAGLLSIVARHTFAGPVPMFIIDASKRGSGKTTLADLAAIISIGVKACRMFYTDDDVEMDKRITALALAGEQLALIDNIVGKLASPPLDAALTSESYRGRVLGKVEMTPAVPMKIVWFSTGNGLIIGADLARRSLLARLEPKTDHPEDRVGPRPGATWRYPNLVNHVMTNRVRYLGYALTIVRAYILAGRPDMRLKPMGSFEAWSDTIRSAIVFAGGVDPCMTIEDTRKADLEDHAFRMMITCWPVDDEIEVTTSTLIEWATIDPPMSADPQRRNQFENTKTLREQWRAALLEWLPARRGDLPTARELGYALRTIKGNIAGDLKIESGEATASGVPWRRVRLGGSSPVRLVDSSLQARMTVIR